jgi:hypothetical protein
MISCTVGQNGLVVQFCEMDVCANVHFAQTSTAYTLCKSLMSTLCDLHSSNVRANVHFAQTSTAYTLHKSLMSALCDLHSSNVCANVHFAQTSTVYTLCKFAICIVAYSMLLVNPPIPN